MRFRPFAPGLRLGLRLALCILGGWSCPSLAQEAYQVDSSAAGATPGSVSMQPAANTVEPPGQQGSYAPPNQLRVQPPTSQPTRQVSAAMAAAPAAAATSPAPVAAASAGTPPATTPAAAAVAAPPAADAGAAAGNASGLPDETSWAAAMQAARDRLADNPELPEDVRAQIADLYTQCIEDLNRAAGLVVRAKELRAELTAAAGELAKLQAAAPAEPGPLPAELAAMSVEEIRAAHRVSDAAVNEQRSLLQGITLEIERRTARLRRVPESLAQARNKLEELNKQLAAAPPSGEHADLTAARRTRLRAASQLQQREIELLQQESKTYEETARLMSQRRDDADRAVKASQRQLSQLQRALAELEKQDAQRQAAAARRAAANAHPAVREAARVNSALAEANSMLVAALETTRTDLKAAEEQSEELAAQYLATRGRAEAANFSPAIGLMLRAQQAELPDTELYRQRARKRQQEQTLLNLKLLEWENERRKIFETDAVVEQHLQMVRAQLGLIEQVDVRNELEQVFTARLDLYADLIANAQNQLVRMGLLEVAEGELIQVIDQQATFISENILWVRSTAPLTPSLLSPLSTAVGSLLDPKLWGGVWDTLRNELWAHPLNELLLIPPVWLILARRRLRARLETYAQQAQRSSATGFSPTLRATICTFLLAVPVPALLSLLGWRLAGVAEVGEFSYTLGRTASMIGSALLVVQFIRYACQEDGLADAHFGWKDDCLEALRRAMALLKVACLPAGFVCLLAEFSGDELIISTVGRVALIIGLLVVASIAFKLLRGGSPLGQMLLASEDWSWAQRTYRLWATALVVVPVVLVIVSAIGYHYTAVRLSTRMAATWGVIALLVGVRALAMRWLLVVYRRFAIERAREKRAVLAARQGVAGDGTDVAIPGDTSLELRLSTINSQARNLIRIFTTVIGAVLLTLIWREIFPALGILDQHEFWPNGVKTPGSDGAQPPVTLLDLLLGATWITLTILGCRNLPGLLDMVVLQRLPLDAGARYAASALTQYVLVVVGAAVCFHQIGIGWQSIQWLVAAMTVGLGFGLQEIFANFVSGIILLFERPVRVGDTVTIGNVSGTVTRIRIRATTVQDWDNKELIVPNRDFVTGNLVNWTLSNPNLRVVIEVGIARQADTELAVKLLHEVARSSPLALADPEPVVVFSRFGPSSLEFELRVFASGVVNSRTLRHQLNMAIVEAFRQHNIEIAYPQHDLHLRSLPAGWDDAMGNKAAAALSGAPPERAAAPADKQAAARADKQVA